jgi:hypothetical protein
MQRIYEKLDYVAYIFISCFQSMIILTNGTYLKNIGYESNEYAGKVDSYFMGVVWLAIAVLMVIGLIIKRHKTLVLSLVLFSGMTFGTCATYFLIHFNNLSEYTMGYFAFGVFLISLKTILRGDYFE